MGSTLAINPKRLIRPPIDPSLHCPCDSKQSAAACCLCADGYVRKYLPSLQPRPPRTGYSQAGCYLSHTNDCSRGITGKHYVSRSALEELSEPVVAIDGVHWLAPVSKGLSASTASPPIYFAAVTTRHCRPLMMRGDSFYEPSKASTPVLARSRCRGKHWCQS